MDLNIKSRPTFFHPEMCHIIDVRCIWYTAPCRPGNTSDVLFEVLCLWSLQKSVSFWCTIKFQADIDKLKLKISVGLNVSNESILPSYICSLADKNHKTRNDACTYQIQTFRPALYIKEHYYIIKEHHFYTTQSELQLV